MTSKANADRQYHATNEAFLTCGIGNATKPRCADPDAVDATSDGNSPLPPLIPLSWYAMPLGLAGLGGAWASGRLFSTGIELGDVITAIAAMIWFGFSVLYAWSCLRSRGTFRHERTHATRGPLSAYIPVIGLLLAIHYEQLPLRIRDCAVALLLAVLAILVALLMAHWFMGDLDQDAVHAGYYLPVVAGPFIGAMAAHACAAAPVAWAAFGVGSFFLLVLGAVIIGRLMFGSKLDSDLLPSTAILLAAPATAAIAWMDLHDNHPDNIAWCLFGIVAVMLFVQLALVPHYLRLSFNMSWWAFSFPLASSTNAAVRLLRAQQSAIGTGFSVAFLILVTAALACLSAATASVVVRQLMNHRC